MKDFYLFKKIILLLFCVFSSQVSAMDDPPKGYRVTRRAVSPIESQVLEGRIFYPLMNREKTKETLNWENHSREAVSNPNVEVVKEPAASPYFNHGCLRMEYDSTTAIGSGTLISNQYVLTAAHNLYDKKSTPNKIIFYQAANGQLTGQGSDVEVVCIHPDWHACGKTERDIGIVKLKNPLTVSNSSIIKPVDQKEIKNFCLCSTSAPIENLELTGYALKFDHGRQMIKILLDNVNILENSQITYNKQTYKGLSGGSIGKKLEDHYCYQGIHRCLTADKGCGVLLDPNLKKEIKEWIEALRKYNGTDPEPSPQPKGITSECVCISFDSESF